MRDEILRRKWVSRIYEAHLALAYSGQMREQARDSRGSTLLLSLAAEMKRGAGGVLVVFCFTTSNAYQNMEKVLHIFFFRIL